MSTSVELQRLLYETLTGDATLTALVNGIYDSVPADGFATPKLAYVRFDAHDYVEDDSDCIPAEEHTFLINVFSRKVGMPNCKEIADRVKALLHNADLALPTAALSFIRVPDVQFRMDPDGKTSRAIIQVTASIEVP